MLNPKDLASMLSMELKGAATLRSIDDLAEKPKNDNFKSFK